MGLFKKLKELFNKNIECGDEIDDHLVFLMKKKKHLYLNKNIYVREKNACVVVYRGRVCDVVLPGKYRLNQDSIPETYGKAKIEKQQSKGKKIKRIRADIYFVNMGEFKQFSYISDSPFKSKASAFGRVKGCLAGTCSIKIIDAGAIVKTLIARKGKIKTNDVKSKIELVVGNKINHIIQKKKVALEMLLNSQEYVESIVNEEMQDALDKQGLFVSNVKLKAVDFSKKHKGKINKYLSNRPSALAKVNLDSIMGNHHEVCEMEMVQTSVRKASNNSVIQNTGNLTIKQGYIECCKCHKKNGLNARICINCGRKLV